MSELLKPWFRSDWCRSPLAINDWQLIIVKIIWRNAHLNVTFNMITLNLHFTGMRCPSRFPLHLPAPRCLRCRYAECWYDDINAGVLRVYVTVIKDDGIRQRSPMKLVLKYRYKIVFLKSGINFRILCIHCFTFKVWTPLINYN